MKLLLSGLTTPLLLAAILLIVTPLSAEAKKSDRCSALNQPPCPAHYIGERCDSGLDDIGGVCKPCGGRNQPACAKIKRGYPCRGSLEPDSRNICRGCGGNGEQACRAMKQGEQCGRYLTKDRSNICRPCGGNNQRPCPVTKKGSICKSGLGKIDGVCRSCGKLNQPACPWQEQGRQCETWTTNRGGTCKPCGEKGTKACRITDKGKACKPGLKRALNGVCVIDEKAALEADSMKRMEEVAGEVMQAVNSSIAAGNNESYMEKIREEDPSFLEDQPDNGNCNGQTMAWSVGVGGDVAFIVGTEGEIGAVMRCGNHAKNQKDVKWYAAGGHNLRPGFGVGGGVTFGFWRSDFDELRGKSHGYLFDLIQLFDTISSGPLVSMKNEIDDLKGMIKTGANVKPDSSFTIGFWYKDYDKDDPRAIENAGSSWEPEFQGWTLTLGKSFGWDAGGKYTKSKTSQMCTVDMKCAEGIWEGDNYRIEVSNQTKQYIRASVNNGSKRKFERVTPAGRKYRAGNGDIIRYRKNYTLLKFDGGQKAELRKSAEELASDSASQGGGTRSTRKALTDKVAAVVSKLTGLKVTGLWSYTLGGNSFTDQILEQSDTGLYLRRVGTDLKLHYQKTGDNEYTNSSGSVLRFVTDTRGIWISADKSVVTQLKKRN